MDYGLAKGTLCSATQQENMPLKLHLTPIPLAKTNNFSRVYFKQQTMAQGCWLEWISQNVPTKGLHKMWITACYSGVKALSVGSAYVFRWWRIGAPRLSRPALGWSARMATNVLPSVRRVHERHPCVRQTLPSMYHSAVFDPQSRRKSKLHSRSSSKFVNCSITIIGHLSRLNDF